MPKRKLKNNSDDSSTNVNNITQMIKRRKIIIDDSEDSPSDSDFNEESDLDDINNYNIFDEWQEGLCKQDIDKYQKMLNELNTDIVVNRDRHIILEILDSNLDNKRKKDFINGYQFLLQTSNESDNDLISFEEIVRRTISTNNKIPKYIVDECNKIEEELNKSIDPNDIQIADLPLRYQILKSNLPDYHKRILLTKEREIEEMDTSNPEVYKLSETIKVVLDLPFVSSKSQQLLNNNVNNIFNSFEINQLLTNIKKNLDDRIYGLNRVKEKVINIVAARLSSPKCFGNIIILKGNPGVGKTEIVKVISEELKIGMEIIPLGGLKNAEQLGGLGSAYIGSSPGLLIKAIRKMKQKDGIILFDEVDKIAEDGKEIYGLLTHILDTTQNNRYYDGYLGDLWYDLSEIWFFLTANNIKLIDPIVLNRATVIDVESPTAEEKVHIGIKFLLPKLLNKVGMKYGDIIISEEIMRHIIKKGKYDPGVRTLLHDLDNIIQKINTMRVAMLPDGTFGELKISVLPHFMGIPLTLTTKDVDILFENFDPKESGYLSMYS